MNSFFPLQSFWGSTCKIYKRVAKLRAAKNKNLSPKNSFLVSPQSHLFYISLFCKRDRRSKSSTDFKREDRLQHSGRNSLVCHSNGPIGNWLDTYRCQLILSLQLMCFFPFVNCYNFDNNNPPNFPRKRPRRFNT